MGSIGKEHVSKDTEFFHFYGEYVLTKKTNNIFRCINPTKSSDYGIHNVRGLTKGKLYKGRYLVKEGHEISKKLILIEDDLGEYVILSLDRFEEVETEVVRLHINDVIVENTTHLFRCVNNITELIHGRRTRISGLTEGKLYAGRRVLDTKDTYINRILVKDDTGEWIIPGLYRFEEVAQEEYNE